MLPRCRPGSWPPYEGLIPAITSGLHILSSFYWPVIVPVPRPGSRCDGSTSRGGSMKIRHGAAVGIGLAAITAGVFPAAASAGPAGAHAATPAIAAGRVQPAGLAARLLPGARTGPNAEAGAISGTVLGAHSAPLAGACVSATGPGNSFTASTRTGGRFLITGLPPGRYVLEYRDCSAPSRYFARWSGGAGSPRGAAPVVVTPASSVRWLPSRCTRRTRLCSCRDARPGSAGRHAAQARPSGRPIPVPSPES